MLPTKKGQAKLLEMTNHSLWSRILVAIMDTNHWQSPAQQSPAVRRLQYEILSELFHTTSDKHAKAWERG